MQSMFERAASSVRFVAGTAGRAEDWRGSLRQSGRRGRGGLVCWYGARRARDRQRWRWHEPSRRVLKRVFVATPSPTARCYGGRRFTVGGARRSERPAGRRSHPCT